MRPARKSSPEGVRPGPRPINPAADVSTRRASIDTSPRTRSRALGSARAVTSVAGPGAAVQPRATCSARGTMGARPSPGMDGPRAAERVLARRRTSVVQVLGPIGGGVQSSPPERSRTIPSPRCRSSPDRRRGVPASMPRSSTATSSGMSTQTLTGPFPSRRSTIQVTLPSVPRTWHECRNTAVTLPQSAARSRAPGSPAPKAVTLKTCGRFIVGIIWESPL